MPASLLFFGEGGFDGGEDGGVVGLGLGLKSGEDGAIATDEEFAEVPFYVAREGGLGAAELLVEGVFFGAFDGEFVKDGEADVVFGGAEFFDLFIGAGFLAAEVVAGKAEDGEAVFFEFLVQGLELFVLLGIAALGGDIDDEHDFAFVGLQAGVLAIDVFERDLIQGASGGGAEEGGEGE